MGTLCASQAVLDRVGINANSTIIASEAIIERYIETAEGVIVAETKRAWVDEFASAPSSVQKILESCTASHAAKNIIMFDMSNFTTRAEAITMLNVNESEFQRTIKALKDQDIIKIRSLSD